MESRPLFTRFDDEQRSRNTPHKMCGKTCASAAKHAASPNHRKGRKGSIADGTPPHEAYGAVFGWLNEAPDPDSECFKTLHGAFPGALPSHAVVSRVAHALKKYDVSPENVVYGQSICPDEINYEDGGLAMLMHRHWGNCFPLGGIGGAPFSGKTGFSAFSHHVPENGNVIVLFGPHVGISEAGEIGKHLRHGQHEHSTACGAVLAAYDQCCAEDYSDDTDWFNNYDMQQGWIRKELAPHIDNIKSAPNPMRALMQRTYESVQAKVLSIVNTDFGKGNLILIGGIQLNLPDQYVDHFQPLFFQIQSASSAPVDILHELRYPSTIASKYVQHGPDGEATKPSPTTELFAWLTLAPKPDTPCFQTLQRAFPGALPGSAVTARVRDLVRPYGVEKGNVVYGQSICPDEINYEDGDLAMLMANHWGNCFPLGGLGGAPFSGKTGFSAFSHHVPENGNVIVLFGPHVGISEAGEIGKYLRHGQHEHSTACGAVLAAYDQCCQGMDEDDHESDMQQSCIRRAIAPHLAAIQSSADPMQKLMQTAYENVLDTVLKVVNTDFGTGKLVLIGGIQINMPMPYQDHFQPLYFQIQSESEPPIDLLPQMSYDAYEGKTIHEITAVLHLELCL